MAMLTFNPAAKLSLPYPYHICIPTSSSMRLQHSLALPLLFLLTHLLPADLSCTALPINSTAPVASQWQISPQADNLTALANANFSLILTRSPSPDSPRCTLVVQHIPSGLPVWVATFYNLSTSSKTSQNCTFTLQRDGNLQLMDNAQLSWQTGTGSRGVSTIQLLGNGNLVLANDTYTNTSLNIVWQSFEHPSDTLVTGQKLGLDATLYAAASDNAYKTGSVYSMALSMYFNDLILYASFNRAPGPQEYWSLQATFATPQNAWVCCGAAFVQVGNGLTIFDNQSQLLISTSSNNLNPNKDLFEYARLEPDGNLRTYVFKGGAWQLNFQALSKACQHPNACGSYGICNSASDTCSSTCLPGFHLVNSSDPSQGCTSSGLPSTDQCKANASSMVTFNETGYTYFFAQNFYYGGEGHADNYSNTLSECQKSCLQNCSCQSAFYSQLTGCYLMEYPIRTIQQSDDDTQVLFFKLSNVSSLVAPAYPPHPASPSPQPQISLAEKVPKGHKNVFAIAFGCAGAAIAIMGLVMWFLRIRKLRGREQEEDEMFLHTLPGLPLRFSYKNLHKATDGFSRKIGAGGFGSVYEGVLSGQETRLAVKKLKNTQQSGIKQFRAEIATLGKISHTNLVRLCGYCIEGSHRLLVYEFMVNKSLDRALFSENGAVMLDWNMRRAIALGTARGLAYLHDECTSRIIHCDVKPENILLDQDCVPKVSDFGLAKLMCRDQSYMVTTMRGTRGYLAPEWIKNAPITEKSDVFSFGIVLLELVAGRRSFDLRAQQPERCYLPAWAFDLVVEGADLLALTDEKLRKDITEKHEIEQVISMAKIALWCIQEEATLRPAMSLVVKMLEGEAEVLPPPVCHFFAKARPHQLQFDSSSPGSPLSVSGSASEQSQTVQSQISWRMSTLVSGR